MLTYATVADMVARFGELELVQLTDLINIPPSTVDAARVETKLGDAAAFIDGYVGQVYRLPLAGCAKPPATPDGIVQYVAPPVLTRLTCDLARYYLYDDLAPEHEVYRRYKAALGELEAIAGGRAQLACPWGGSPGELIGSDAQSGSAETYSDFAPRAVTSATLRGFG
ncbi:Mu-like prophage protein GP36 [plant metagenome]|uniref:Mu-like prophage protein GP36 n=1 Tax=plant metagenome TaxID=1297885 RepID=A0A484UNI4_9ZZZZ